MTDFVRDSYRAQAAAQPRGPGGRFAPGKPDYKKMGAAMESFRAERGDG
jgi:hypothetical protein